MPWCLISTSLVLGMVLGCGGRDGLRAPRPVDEARGTAAPAASAPPARVDEAAYRAALRQGRALSEKRDYRAAMAAFEQALQHQPGAGEALSELGWAAFRAGELDRAVAATRQAMAALVTDNAAHAAALYNLGRIFEARGDAAAAVIAYRRSLRLRPHHAVEERLVKLASSSGMSVYEASLPYPLQVRMLRGPYASIKAYCKELERSASDDGATCDVNYDSASGLTGGPHRIAGPPAPYDAVEIFASEELDGYCNLAISVAGKWYIDERTLECFSERARASIEVTARELAVRDVMPGGHPEIALRVEVVAETDPEALEEEPEVIERTATTYQVYCGVGESRRPTCTGAIAVARTESEKKPSGKRFRVTAQHELTLRAGAAELVVEPRAGSRAGPRAGSRAGSPWQPELLGTHELVFP
jgi:tetratricopeptide (TPR) repeat protein